MTRKRIWVYDDVIPTFVTHLISGSRTNTPSLVSDYLLFTTVVSGSGYLYSDCSNLTDYVIQDGDYLEYDIYWETAGNIMIAIDLAVSDGGELRDSGATDQNSLPAYSAYDISAQAYGQWYHRKIPITTLNNGNSVGKALQYFDLVSECDTNGTYVARFKNIAITDGNGVSTPLTELSKALSSTPLVTDSKLQGYWKLEDVNDSGKNGYTLTNNGGLSFSAGKFNNGASFVKTSSQYLTRAHASSANLEITGNQTWMCWVKLTTNTDDCAIMDKQVNARSLRAWLPYVSALMGGCTVQSRDLKTATWYHLAMTYDGAHVVLYVNGIQEGSQAKTGALAASTDEFAIGTVSNNHGNLLNGMVDDAAIFNRALTADEIMLIYSRGRTGSLLQMFR